MTSQRRSRRPMIRQQMTALQSNSDETFWMQFSHVGGLVLLQRRSVRLKHQRGRSWEEVEVQEQRCANRRRRLHGSRKLEDLPRDLDVDSTGIKCSAGEIYLTHPVSYFMGSVYTRHAQFHTHRCYLLNVMTTVKEQPRKKSLNNYI